MVYYGDEVGCGADDPTRRKPMLWDDLQPYEQPGELREMISFYSGDAAKRSLRNAFYTPLIDDEKDGCRGDATVLIVALNAGAEVCPRPLTQLVLRTWRAPARVENSVIKLPIGALRCGNASGSPPGSIALAADLSS